MLRSIRGPLAVFLISLASAATVRAQGWGWDGWGGWTSTPAGSLAQGMGHYYQGAGIFNERTAIANSIDADTLMRWNDYLYHANDEALRRYVARRRENSGTFAPRTTRSTPGFAIIPPSATSKWAMRSTPRSIN